MNLGIVIYILLCHIIGDYFLQNAWMAYNKHRFTSTGWIAATVHCWIYTAVFIVVLFWDSGYADWSMGYFCFACKIFTSHFVIDKFPLIYWYVTKVLRRKLTDAPPGEIAVNTFVYIVIDNMAHIVLIYFLI